MADGDVVQLACLPPDQVTVEQRGQRIVDTLHGQGGVSEHGPEDIVAIKRAARRSRGMSPVRQCARALQINGLLTYAAAWLANAGRPSGILSLSGELP